jgi:hypothetical protein
MRAYDSWLKNKNSDFLPVWLFCLKMCYNYVILKLSQVFAYQYIPRIFSVQFELSQLQFFSKDLSLD